jgi:hypothetical protein
VLDALVLQNEASQPFEEAPRPESWGTQLYNLAYDFLTNDQLARNAQVSRILKVGL